MSGLRPRAVNPMTGRLAASHHVAPHTRCAVHRPELAYIHSVPIKIASMVTSGLATMYVPMREYKKMLATTRETVVAIKGSSSGRGCP